jgi:hypothetical protein
LSIESGVTTVRRHDGIGPRDAHGFVTAAGRAAASDFVQAIRLRQLAGSDVPPEDRLAAVAADEDIRALRVEVGGPGLGERG